MGSGRRVTIGYKIYLGIQQVLCRGPIDAIHRVRVDEQPIYQDFDGATEERITVDKEDLFGGKKQEGGISGDFDIEFGGPTQQPNDYLQSLLGDDIPAFRGVVQVILRRMYIGTQPYLKKWDFRAKRIHTRQDGQTQWYNSKAGIGGIKQPYYNKYTFRNWGSNTLIVGAGQEVSGGFQPNNNSWDGYIDSMRVTKNVCRYNALTIDPITAAFTLAGDEHASNVVLLNNFEGADTSQPATDDTGNSLSWSVASISTDEAKFGSSSGEFTGTTSDYLSTSCDTDLGEQFTIECWGYLRSKSSSTFGRVLLSCGPVNTPAQDSYWGVLGDNLQFTEDFTAATPDTESFRVEGYLDNVSLNEWHHFAMTRDEAGYYRMYVDFEMVVGFVSDMNPAHIIRECLTDPDWGMGYPEDDIGDSFTTAADTLYSEEFGLSLQWDRQRPINEFITDILEHIDAALYVSKTTGKFELKLIRDDWADSEMITLDEDNIETVDDFSRTAFGELVNSVSVVFYNADLSKDDAVQVQDIALIQQQGTIIETTVNYPGIRNTKLAARVAERELKSMSTPLVSCTVVADRSAAGLNVGDAFIMDWPDYDINNMTMRVAEVGYGDARTNRVQLKVVQDVFDTGLSAVVAESSTQTPSLEFIPAAASPREVMEAPYYMAVQTLGESETNNILSTNASAGYLISFGGRPNTGQVNAQLWTDSGTGYVEQQTLDFCAIVKPYIDSSGFEIDETATVISVENVVDMDLIEPPTFALWGDEIIRVDSLMDGSDGIYDMTIGRGCLDTIPQVHTQDSGGQYIYFIEEDIGFDTNEYNDGETVTAAVLSTTLNDSLALDDAPTDSLTFGSRAVRPYPPGNFKVNSERFPSQISGTLVLSWAHRDRLQQTGATIEDNFDGDIGPEAGTTYNIRIYDASDVLLKEVTGLTDTSYTWSTEGVDSGLISSGFTGTYDDEVLDESPDLFWPMNDDSSGSCEDVSGNARHGTFGSGVTLQQPPATSVGYSISATANSEIAISGPSIVYNDDLVAMIWFKADAASAPSANRIIFGSLKAATFAVWAIRIMTSTGVARFDINDSASATNYETLECTTDVCDGDWHLIGISWSRNEDKKMRIYIDGVLENTSAVWDYQMWADATHGIQVYNTTASESFSFDGAWCSRTYINESRQLDFYESRNVADSEGNFELNAQLRVELESERDGYTSLQMYNHTVTRP